MTKYQTLMDKANLCMAAAIQALDPRVKKDWKRKSMELVIKANELSINEARKSDNFLICSKLLDFQINHHGQFCGTYRWLMREYEFIGNARRMNYGWEVTPTIVSDLTHVQDVESLRDDLESEIRYEIRNLINNQADPAVARWI